MNYAKALLLVAVSTLTFVAVTAMERPVEKKTYNRRQLKKQPNQQLVRRQQPNQQLIASPGSQATVSGPEEKTFTRDQTYLPATSTEQFQAQPGSRRGGEGNQGAGLIK